MSDAIRQITDLVEADPIDVEALERAFDSATHQERVAAIRQFTKSIQRRLFEQTEGREVTLEAMVPPHAPPLQEVVHEGQNTLPVFSSFQKRFCAPSSEHTAGGDRLWGYNEQTMRMFTGPGYFVAYDDTETDEVCIDYREVPPEAPDEWPDVVPSKNRLGRFVYAGTVDRLRRVSEHCTIGRAFDDDSEPMDNWFALVRTPV